MRSSLKPLVPLLLLAAAVAVTVLLLARAPQPVPERPASPQPAAAPAAPARPAPGTPSPAPPPAPAPPEKPPAPAASARLAAWLDTLGRTAAAYAFLPDLPALLAAAEKSNGWRLVERHLRPQLLRREEDRKKLLALRRRARALREAARAAEAAAVLCVDLPERMAPAVVTTEEAAPRLMAPLQEMFPQVNWKKRPLGGGLAALGDEAACAALPRATVTPAAETPRGPQVVLGADRRFLLYLAAVAGGQAMRHIDTYTAGVEEVRGRVEVAGGGLVRERCEVHLRPNGEWPLMALGGPPVETALLATLPETSLAAVVGYAEMPGILPQVEKDLSRLAPGIRLGPLLGAGLEGPAAAGVASPRATWQPAWYGVLEPRSGGRAVAAFGRAYEEFCRRAGLEVDTVEVEGIRVHYARTTDLGKLALAALVPAWCEREGKLLLGQGALGLKEMLRAKTLAGLQAFRAAAGELPEKASGAVFVDLERLARLAYESQSILLLNRLRLRAGLDLDPEALPTSREVAQMLRPAVAWSLSSRDRLELAASGPLPVSLLLLLGVFFLD